MKDWEGRHAALLRQQNAMAKFGELALRSDNLDVILTEACHLIADALGTDLAKVMEMQDDGETLLVRAGVGWKPGVIGVVTVRAADNTSEGIALRTGEPMISPDIATETRFTYPAFLTENGVRAIANVLIIGGQNRRPFGILQIDSRQPRDFDAEDTTFLRSYANLLAAAVDRLRNHKEARAAESRLLHGQRIEAVGRLSAGVAHDFNNVLQVLLGGLELAIAGLDDRPAVRADLELALGAAERGARLTSHLLSFSRQQTLFPERTELAPLLSQLASTLKRTLGHRIAVTVSAAPDLPEVLADQSHLDAALLNLALNARDAMPQGGTLHIDAQAVAGQVVIAISDSGEGMSPEVVALACDPFFTTKGAKGSGLGLAMVQGFARQSGGELSIRSTPGEGTRVEIGLPAAPRSEVPSPMPQPFPVTGKGAVLLVDDDPDVLLLTAAFLRNAGYEVTAASSGDAAMATLHAVQGFDVMVTDFAMRGMDGGELARMSRELLPTLPIMVMSGYAGMQEMERLPAGINVLHKPFRGADMVRRIRELIEAARTGAPP